MLLMKSGVPSNDRAIETIHHDLDRLGAQVCAAQDVLEPHAFPEGVADHAEPGLHAGDMRLGKAAPILAGALADGGDSTASKLERKSLKLISKGLPTPSAADFQLPFRAVDLFRFRRGGNGRRRIRSA